jgi:hypothetical protein
MLVRNNPRSFLTGDDPFLPVTGVELSSGRLEGQVTFEPKHEGFIGIPHGGLSMGLCVDAWRRTDVPRYPVNLKFRFGGSGITIGESAVFTVERSPDGKGAPVTARITKNGDKTPYLRAEITPAEGPVDHGILPAPPPETSRPLPYYRNCFVCGGHRTIIGLQRRFRVHEEAETTVITTPWGLDPTDGDRAAHFLIGTEELHPTVLLAIFDENTAWGGFMQTRSAGLSVRLEVTLLRPVGRHERLLFVGRPAGIRGSARAPRFFLAEGTILALNDPENPEVVAFGRGEWIVMNSYTSQIKKNLLPPDDWEWIFG